MPKALDHDVLVLAAGEDIHPVHCGVADEIQAFRIMELVRPAHGLANIAWGGQLQTGRYARGSPEDLKEFSQVVPPTLHAPACGGNTCERWGRIFDWINQLGIT